MDEYMVVEIDGYTVELEYAKDGKQTVEDCLLAFARRTMQLIPEGSELSDE